MLHNDNGNIVHVDPAPQNVRVPSRREVEAAMRRVVSLVGKRDPDAVRVLQNALVPRLR